MTGRNRAEAADTHRAGRLAERPLPSPDPDTAPFWAGCRRHTLLIQRCGACQRFRHYPRPMCPQCLSMDSTWAQTSGRGTVFSWVVVHPPVIPAFQARVPFAVALVALDEDPQVRLLGNLVHCAPESIAIGMPVEVVFEDVAPDVTLPQWRPRSK